MCKPKTQTYVGNIRVVGQKYAIPTLGELRIPIKLPTLYTANCTISGIYLHATGWHLWPFDVSSYLEFADGRRKYWCGRFTSPDEFNWSLNAHDNAVFVNRPLATRLLEPSVGLKGSYLIGQDGDKHGVYEDWMLVFEDHCSADGGEVTEFELAFDFNYKATTRELLEDDTVYLGYIHESADAIPQHKKPRKGENQEI